MRRTLAVMTGVLAALAAAVPASAQVPSGTGLIDAGPFSCSGDLGQIEVLTPPGNQSATGFTTTGGHAVLFSLTVTGTDPVGNAISFSKSYGTKAGLTPQTCTQHFDNPQMGVGDVTAVVGVVPAG
jgi:hypothetical protein